MVTFSLGTNLCGHYLFINISSSLMCIIVSIDSSVIVILLFPLKLVPVNECNWHLFSIVQFVIQIIPLVLYYSLSY